MKKTSIWLEEKDKLKPKKLTNDIKVDVLIIGAGITGLSTAYHLKDANLTIAVVDSDLVGHGVTSRTTGKLTYLQGSIYTKLNKDFSFKNAKMYYKSQKDAINLVKDIVTKENISCNLEKANSIVYATSEDKIEELKKEKKLLKRFGALVEEENNRDYSIIRVNDTYVFHPLKYLYALKEICCKNNINIYEYTKIIDIVKDDEKYICKTKDHTIVAQKVVVACHYPFFLFPFFLPIRTYVEQSYIMAYKTKKNENISFISIEKQQKSYRFYEDKFIYKLYLSNSHNLANHLNRKENFNELLEGLLGNSPDYIWTNDDLITIDNLPYIGKMKKNNNNLYLATGYNTWGMTNGSIAGKIIADLIMNRKNEYAYLFNPNRTSSFKAIIKSIKDVFKNGKSYIENKLFKKKKWYGSNITFEKKNGYNLANYYDGKENHTIINQCPHMGCSLIFNEVEKIWECPCHASKFDIDGKCIKGPSKYNIEYNDKKL